MRADRAKEIDQRAKSRDGGRPKTCIVEGCGRLTQRAAGNGLSGIHCKRHVEMARRHGSAWRKSYSATEIGPIRKAAAKWYALHADEPLVRQAVAAFDSTIDSARGDHDAKAVRWMLPEEKARAALARLRKAGKTGKQLLLIVLSVKAAYAALGPRANPEFRHTQIGKQAHRLRNASGTHIPAPLYGGTIHQWPRAEGQVVRILGGILEDIAGIAITNDEVEQVLELAGKTRL